MSGKACCSPSRGSSGMSTDQVAAEILQAAQPADAEGMVYLPGGTFLMGTDDPAGFPADGEGPVRDVRLNAFYIDTCVVTNRAFAEFVDATGYVTEAEWFGWSFVFAGFLPANERRDARRLPDAPWWCAVAGADWAHPEGRQSSFADRLDHPVVHVSWNDAVAYCRWAGKRLPTEAESEYAARGGLEQARYPWGDELTPDGQWRCNIWQGKFPTRNTAEDGWRGTAPVAAYAANGFGLHNVAGNVWEWCTDWFSATRHANGPRTNPRGPTSGESKVIRGGSYLCHESYCNRYRVAARTSNAPDSSSGNLGFRCVSDN